MKYCIDNLTGQVAPRWRRHALLVFAFLISSLFLIPEGVARKVYRRTAKSSSRNQIRMGSMDLSTHLGAQVGLGRLPHAFKIATDFDVSVNGPLHLQFGVGFAFTPSHNEYVVGDARTYFVDHPENGRYCETDGRCWIWDNQFNGGAFDLQLTGGIKYKFLNLRIPLVPYISVGIATDFLFTGEDYFLFGIGPRIGPGLKYMFTKSFGLGIEIPVTLQWAFVANDYQDSGFAGSVDFLFGCDFLF